MVLLEELSRMESELAERPQSQTDVDEKDDNEVWHQIVFSQNICAIKKRLDTS